jgi:hypothetical protein
VPQAGQQQVGPMFGHHQGLGLGKVEHLSGGMVHGHHLAQGRAASGADLREMVDPGVGRFRPAERLAGMTRLAAGLLPEASRRLPTRTSFFSPSLDGGLPLLALFSPSRRSSSAMRASCVRSSAMRSSLESWLRAA